MYKTVHICYIGIIKIFLKKIGFIWQIDVENDNDTETEVPQPEEDVEEYYVKYKNL